MAHLQRLRKMSVLGWVSSNTVNSQLKTPNTPVWQIWRFHIAQNPRFYRTRRVVQTETFEKSDACSREKIPAAFLKDAEAALLEYLHCTRSLPFLDAEYMSKNSPFFIQKLVKKVGMKSDVGQAFTRHLRYHPINEFEPFFESLGLTPSEYCPLLPRDRMFLTDDDYLLDNYHVLREYGIDVRKIGKIYKEAKEVFNYGRGLLLVKLQAYEELGLSNSSVAKFIISSPNLLVGDVSSDFVDVLKILERGGIQLSWIEEHLSVHHCYDWSRMLGLLRLFCKTGYSEEQLGALITQSPELLFEDSGYKTLSLIGFLVKFGSQLKDICSLFPQFPQIQVGKFFSNMRQCFLFLNEIEMEVNEIGKLVRSYPFLLGSCTLKKTSSLLSNLNTGKKRLCKLVQENPQELRNLVLGSKIVRLPYSGEDERSRVLKTKFLLDLGFVEESNEMKRALKAFRGKGGELQERFDCIVKAGIDKKDVYEMIKGSPQILNQSKEVIETKISFLVNDSGYPISTLKIFPSFLNYTTQRVKLRLSMYNWLKEQGGTEPKLALSSVVACSDKIFVSQYVHRHPTGPQVWQDLKKQIYSE
ncbi:Mitochondrial transcription termination factor family protein putative isoform 2 [Tripterygium wilfordii]|uniref:Mitochondrial transcription termination factor family protein putative isoform 2 n=1 Tax=Tripterygium wilfordii TaxID=458696 RepID=A0A7J7DWE0_TRIWF|nr:transcription termination factor MTEF18, mitochondrial-like [Tripterygium wilfordii]KAF5750692.1 Mitochondrial transcription termination factor family protein putative isoform 2 [Tripterygium wilfordii]